MGIANSRDVRFTSYEVRARTGGTKALNSSKSSPSIKAQSGPTVEVWRQTDVTSPGVANAGTADQLAEAFGLGRVTGPMTAIERSWAGEVWSLPSDRGRWAATQLFEWTPVIDNHLDDEVRLVEAAGSAGLAAPLPVRSTDGRVLVTIGDHRWRVHEEVKLGPAPVRVTSDVAAVAGHALGVLHRLSLPTGRSITAPPSAPVQARWLSSRPTEASWQYLARQATEAGRPWAAVLQTAIPALLDISAVCADLSTEPVVLSKYRLLPTDLRPAPDGGWVILNWEHAGPIPPRQELGASLAECDKGTTRPCGVLFWPAIGALASRYQRSI